MRLTWMNYYDRDPDPEEDAPFVAFGALVVSAARRSDTLVFAVGFAGARTPRSTGDTLALTWTSAATGPEGSSRACGRLSPQPRCSTSTSTPALEWARRLDITLGSTITSAPAN
jgi:hypothetical protein